MTDTTERARFEDRPLVERLSILANEAGGGDIADALEEAADALEEAAEALSTPQPMGEDAVERVARAMNGPFYEVPIDSRYTLEELREIRWARASPGTRAILRQQAKIAIADEGRCRSERRDSMTQQDEAVERAAEAVYDFLHERFPEGALPGGKQIFADDHLDADFKHEAGCEALARVVLNAAALPSSDALEMASEALVEAAFREGHRYGRCDGSLLDMDDDWLKSESYKALTKLGGKEEGSEPTR